MILEKATLTGELHGNKAAHLVWLETKKIPTSPFAVLSLEDLIVGYTTWYHEFRQAVTHPTGETLHSRSSQIIWNESNLTRDVHRLKALLGETLVSVRTSVSLEDSSQASFAGLYHTSLNTPLSEEALKREFLACLQHLFTPSVQAYQKQKQLISDKFTFSIIVQAMFQPVFSGVAFIREPLHGSRLVHGKGLGNNIVSGTTGEEYLLTQGSSTPIPESLHQKNCQASWGKLLAALEAISQAKPVPQDVEWAITEEQICILQTRDITTAFSFLKQDVEIFDATNIAESYPGVTLPLTYSFIKEAYARVYAGFLELVGTSPKKRKQAQPILENLLGYIDGHVYYKIFNWYRMISLLPGYRYNKDFFEAMLMPKKRLLPRDHQAIRPKKRRSLLSVAYTFPQALRFIFLLLFSQSSSRRFLRTFNERLQRHKRTSLSTLSAKEILAYYHDLSRRFFDDWKIPILNDFRVMIFFGLLQKTLRHQFPSDYEERLTSLITNFSQQDDLDMLAQLRTLGTKIAGHASLRSLFAEKSPEGIYATLVNSSDPAIRKFSQSLRHYLEQYGSRRPGELKLESIELTTEPALFIPILQQLASLPTPSPTPTPHESSTLTVNRWVVQLFLPFLVRSTHRAIRERELFRLKRAQAFSIARDCFLALGEHFSEQGILVAKRDIFYLSTEEIKAMIQADCFDQDFKQLIDQRKRLYDTYRSQPRLARRLKVTGCGPDAQRTVETDGIESTEQSGLFSGQPTSPGVVTAPVLVLPEFDPAADYRGKILVTYQTDPGWSIVFPLLSGIILEKGNTLSHAAILSRELGIPCVVKAENIMDCLNTGDKVLLNGTTGTLTLLHHDTP